MRFRKTAPRDVARERLQAMVELGTLSCTPEQMTQMKKEMTDIIARYLPTDPDNYEIRILLKQKRA